MPASLYLKEGIPPLIYNLSQYIPQVEAELLLSHVFKYVREGLYVNNIIIDDEVLNLCRSLVRRRLSGEPLQYITGNASFMDMDFFVTKDTFIPRPETELLVYEILRTTNYESRITNRALRIMDLCSGCGNIAISLARSMSNAEIVATDISRSALDVAELNCATYGLEKKISFYQGDLFQALSIDKEYKFDIIVTNPPYIKTRELESLQREVLFEPRVALDAGPDGLDFYRRIADNAIGYLKKGGSIFLEIGIGQAIDVKQIFESKKIFRISKVISDLSGIERVIWISLL